MKAHWIHPKKEFVVKRRAVKRHKCHETSKDRPTVHFIEIGEEYYEDHISYVRRRQKDESGYVWWHTHRVCEGCWRGIKLEA